MLDSVTLLGYLLVTLQNCGWRRSTSRRRRGSRNRAAPAGDDPEPALATTGVPAGGPGGDCEAAQGQRKPPPHASFSAQHQKVTVVRKPATKARKGINPFTKEEVMFKAKPARNVVKVRPLKNLKAIVETGRPPFATRLMYMMFGAMEFVLPGRTKAEHWPLDRKDSK